MTRSSIPSARHGYSPRVAFFWPPAGGEDTRAPPSDRPGGAARLRILGAAAVVHAGGRRTEPHESSISRQVSALERQIGKKLFTRRTRALELTDAGARLFTTVKAALAGIDRTVGEIRGVGGPPRVTLTTTRRSPRSGSCRACPNSSARMPASTSSSMRPIAWWTSMPKASTSRSAGCRLVCPFRRMRIWSPRRDQCCVESAPGCFVRCRTANAHRPRQAAAAGDGRVGAEHALQQLGRVVRVVGIPPLDGAARLYFTYVDQSVQAAVRGQGVALVRTPFLDDLVAGGDLVTPFPHLRMPTGYATSSSSIATAPSCRTSRRSATRWSPSSPADRTGSPDPAAALLGQRDARPCRRAPQAPAPGERKRRTRR